MRRKVTAITLAAIASWLAACGSSTNSTTVSAQDALTTATPIKHLVVIYGENQSFDHYFGTYPNADNPSGEPAFTAASGTPTVNGLTTTLLTDNPNSYNATNLTISGITAAYLEPFRIDRSQANTASQNHNYSPEQEAEDNGAMDEFPYYTGKATTSGSGVFDTKGMVMGYFDGNTVTAMWNYAQHFAMNDNAYTGTFGPSTPGALEVISGQTNGVTLTTGTSTNSTSISTGTSLSTQAIADGADGFTLIGDLDPTNDTCTISNDSSTTVTAAMTSSNKNIGDLLNSAGITWGGFMGGFNLDTVNANGTTGCSRSTYSSVLNSSIVDYVPHHAWFQYYTTTSNPAHTRPTSTADIGYTEPKDSTSTPVHHQYDINDFYTAVKAGNFPSVSFLKAPAVQDAHAGNSDPLDEQAFVTNVVNFLEEQPDWKNTAVIIAYDDSDGWYDHQYITPTSASYSSNDYLNGSSTCGSGTAPLGVAGSPANGRCGPGTRTPFIVISPWARSNYVDSTAITQASITRFIEDNWLGGTRIGSGSFDDTAGSITAMFNFSGSGNNSKLYLDSNYGTKLSSAPAISVTN
ncbi:Phospholipase [Paraburkholderia tropica]|uniref:phospholipase C n=1 Tax=Paraburkholderia TaxID=1822464 RepID=UPI001CB64F08|nr:MULTISPECIES: alkaline phosphatase family protein [Paraburkholderia]CAG9222195.1 Phospholipase [Paraburkholderia tropica]